MKYVDSTIGLDDQVIINDVNYFSLPGPSFTPGVGGTYKDPAPPSLGNPPLTGNLGAPQEKVGCQLARSAGWGTPSWCSEKTQECALKRPLEPQRHIEPGKLDYLLCAHKTKQLKESKKQKAFQYMIIALIICLLLLGLFGDK